MISVISGEDIVSSRKKLLELTRENTSIVRLDGKKATIAEAKLILESNDLFEIKRTVVVEGFTKIKPFKDFLLVVDKFSKDVNTAIVLWEGDDLPAPVKATLKVA